MAGERVFANDRLAQGPVTGGEEKMSQRELVYLNEPISRVRKLQQNLIPKPKEIFGL